MSTGGKRRVGLYGGTFDPIHFGHINLALELKERHRLNEVWFCPARVAPHRLEHRAASPQHRLEMVTRAIEPIPDCKVLDLEIGREVPSFTIDTIRMLTDKREEFGFDELFLIVSDETAQQMHKWREVEEIIQRATPLVGRRLLEDKILLKTGEPKLDAALQAGFIATPVFEINATYVRERMRAGLYCGHLVPPEALSYALENQLYH